mmetsp:Transcript_49122/g.106831  ORF Transcript_49122/g.106831 Transcript_49122/m.106831 type:complete len:1016 (-) Transcript_49122:54-3101(-)
MGSRLSSAVVPVESSQVGVDGADPDAEDMRPVRTMTYNALCSRTAEWFGLRNDTALSAAIAFVPWIIMQSYLQGNPANKDSIVHRGEGTVLFLDLTGFMGSTQQCFSEAESGEQQFQSLSNFFTPILDIINSYRGDVIKFSSRCGQSLTVYFPAFDDTQLPSYEEKLPPHGSYGLPDLGPIITAVLRACCCAIELHRYLDRVHDGLDDDVPSFSIGLGSGHVAILEVGGQKSPDSGIEKYEYVITGSPVEQMMVSEGLAYGGETCLSPETWNYAMDWAIDGRSLDESGFHILDGLDPRYTFPCVRNAAIERDNRYEDAFQLSELGALRHYMPSRIFRYIELDLLHHANEVRTVSALFISSSGTDVSKEEAAPSVQELVNLVQIVCFAYEGSLCRCIVDDKGMLFLLVFGLPPLVHSDDPLRSVLAGLDIIEAFKSKGFVSRCGVSSGRSYCGIIGTARRMEYTVLGDPVDLSARLMAAAAANSMLVDEVTRNHCIAEVPCKASLPIPDEKKDMLVAVFEPEVLVSREEVGLCHDGRVNFPWEVVGATVGGTSKIAEIVRWPEKQKLQQLVDDQHCGLIVMSGEKGTGKTELIELAITETLTNFGGVPIFCTEDWRPRHPSRLVREMLYSSVAALQCIDEQLPREPLAALAELAGGDMQDFVRTLQPDLSVPGDHWSTREVEDEGHGCQKGIDLTMQLLRRILEHRPAIVAVTRHEGSSLCVKAPPEQDDILWLILERLRKLQCSGIRNPLTVLLAMRRSMESCPSRLSDIISEDGNSEVIRLLPWSGSSIREYIGRVLNIEEERIPLSMEYYVECITGGNALFVAETINALLRQGHLTPASTASDVDWECINVAEWTSTVMVARTVSMLEALEPLQLAVVKMASVFDGPFKFVDLSASHCSSWGGATLFDVVRLFHAVKVLKARGIIETVEIPSEASEAEGEVPVDNTQESYRLASPLIKMVAFTLISKVRRAAVKRQALVNRAVKLFLPIHLENLQGKKAIPHVPWYYQIDYPR